ncbi:MAG: hypothetical protein AABZ60_16690 [Planctomycetota bacterium]|mgnify:CR=1 FL=1
MNTTNHFSHFIQCASALSLLSFAIFGCATGPEVDPEKERQTQELSMMKEELSHLQGENQNLSKEKQEVSVTLDTKNSELDQLKNHTKEQKEALAKRDQMINDLSGTLKTQEEALKEKEAKLSSMKEVKKEEAPKPVEMAKTETPKGKYHLRIISLPARERYETYVKKLQEYLVGDKFFDVTARKSGNYWVVDMGNFNSFKDSEAVNLRNKMKDYHYEGVPQFKDCLYVKY